MSLIKTFLNWSLDHRRPTSTFYRLEYLNMNWNLSFSLVFSNSVQYKRGSSWHEICGYLSIPFLYKGYFLPSGLIVDASIHLSLGFLLYTNTSKRNVQPILNDFNRWAILHRGMLVLYIQHWKGIQSHESRDKSVAAKLEKKNSFLLKVFPFATEIIWRIRLKSLAICTFV